MSNALLRLQGVTVRFGGLVAASKVDLTVSSGSISAIIGPNGAGKTTVFNCVTGVYTPTEGTVLVAGKDVRIPFSTAVVARAAAFGIFCGVILAVAVNVQTLWEASINNLFIYGEPFAWGSAVSTFFATLQELPPERTLLPALLGTMLGAFGTLTTWKRTRHTPYSAVERGIARTFQNIRLFRDLTAAENVLVGMHRNVRTNPLAAALRTPQYKRAEADRRTAALEYLAIVGLEGSEDLPARSLPYGHQRRLEIARALATNPSVLLLDEPAAGMNPSEMGDLGDLISRVRARGVTVVLIEHHMKLVMGISDHVTVLEYGEKISEGDPSTVQSDPRVIAAYLGDSGDGK